MDELQKRIDAVNRAVTAHFGEARDTQALMMRTVLKLMEELGELSEATLAEMGLQRDEKLAVHTSDTFEKELADVIVTALTLARYRGYDLYDLIDRRLRTIEKRFDI